MYVGVLYGVGAVKESEDDVECRRLSWRNSFYARGLLAFLVGNLWVPRYLGRKIGEDKKKLFQTRRTRCLMSQLAVGGILRRWMLRKVAKSRN